MSDQPKIKVATAWLGGCSGCHMSFLDLDERLLDLVALVEFTASPITDVKEIPQVDVGIVEGAVCNDENERVLRTMRARCKVLVALGGKWSRSAKAHVFVDSLRDADRR